MRLEPTLRAIAEDTRGFLRQWTADFTEAESTAPDDPRAPNPLAWQLGHLACTEDEVVRLFAPGEEPAPLVPASLQAMCASGSPAPTPDARYPSLAELWALLDRTHAALLALLDGASPDDLDRPPRTPHPAFTSLGQALYETALNENYHIGQIGALRKLLGKPRIM